jgi:hypothetical protein
MDLRANGAAVASFMGRLRNLYRVGELTLNIADMYLHGPWRAYEHNAGPVRWRECEFDYFLISVGAPRDDIARVVAWNRIGASLAPGMTSDDPRKRRSLTAAAAAWPSDTGESFLDRATRLGWIAKGSAEPRAVAVVSSYARAVASDAMPLGARARRYRRRTLTLTAAQRAALDAEIARLRHRYATTELRYLREGLLPAGAGRPRLTGPLTRQAAYWRRRHGVK